MLAGIRDILIISTPDDLPRFRSAARRRQRNGASSSPMPSSRDPTGLAEAFIIGARLRRRAAASCLILGDNIFYGAGLHRLLSSAARPDQGRDGVRLSGQRSRSAMAS